MPLTAAPHPLLKLSGRYKYLPDRPASARLRQRLCGNNIKKVEKHAQTYLKHKASHDTQRKKSCGPFFGPNKTCT